MATQYRAPVLWRVTVAAGRRKRRRSADWLWPIVAPVGLGLVATAGFAVLGGPSWADPQVVTPSGLPVQVHPTFPEPGLPAYSFPAGGGTLLGGSVGSGDPGGSGTVGGTSDGSGGQPLSTLASDYQQYVGSYYGVNQECVSLTRSFDPSLPPSSQWQQGELVQGATDIPVGTPIATFNFDGAYGPPDHPGGWYGVSHTGIYLGQDATGVQILDQFVGSGGAEIHTIPWSSWGSNTAEAGNRYYTIR
jgi:hypothetical protein